MFKRWRYRRSSKDHASQAVLPRNSVCPETAADIWPCLKGTTLSRQPELAPYEPLLAQRVHAPRDDYQSLYLPVFYRCLELCQAMPWSLENSKPYSAVRRVFDITGAVLTARQGCAWPPGTSAETVSAQDALWTYALFTASILSQLPRMGQDRRVQQFDCSQQFIGEWSPFHGSLYAPQTGYRCVFTDQIQQPLWHHTQLRLIWAGCLIPTAGRRWLSRDPQVCRVWWDTLVPHATGSTLFRGLLDSVAKQLGYSADSTTCPDQASASQPVSSHPPQQEKHHDKKTAIL